jgi:hypothetical protein
MGISLRNRKLLWVRSGNKCAFPGCDRDLVLEAEDEIVTDTIVSQEAHIVARQPDGPRGVSDLTEEERDLYDNLLLLCLEHHKVVDDDPTTWSVKRLHEIKSDHETRVREAMSPKDELRAKQELIYASFITAWLEKAQIDSWETWTSWQLAVRPHGPKELLPRLNDLLEWLFNRPWPGMYPELEVAFENFRRVLEHFVMVVGHSADPEEEDYHIDMFYKKELVEQHVYDSRLEAWEWIVDLVHDLVAELTRAGELVIERVRLLIDPLFRIQEGLLTIQRQGAGFYFLTYKPRYSNEEASLKYPYPGLRKFIEIRSQRDVCFGSGMHRDAYRRVTPIVVGEEGYEPWESSATADATDEK